MEKTPKSMRLQLGLFGRTNVGKSSFLNMVAAQDVAITSSMPGTTTDVVEKPMELLPLGPVVFLDTAGLDDSSQIGNLRIAKTHKIFARSDIIILLTEPGAWGEYEEKVAGESEKHKTPLIVVINKSDLSESDESFLKEIKKRTGRFFHCSSIDRQNRDLYVNKLKKMIIEVCPDGFFNPPPLIADLLPPAGIAVLIVPIDLEAPKGRIILPQVQTIRDLLDNKQCAVVVKEMEYPFFLTRLKEVPDIVVCDSQVVLKMVADTPENVTCTTFSILFSRYKGDLVECARGVAAIENLAAGDKILIAEACSHHPIEDDIGRVKIPAWLKKYTGVDLDIDVCSGRDYPEDIAQYKLIIHCGACMLTRREMLFRIHRARQAEVPITNYGVCISFLQGVAERTLSPFPEALEAMRTVLKTTPKRIKN